VERTERNVMHPVAEFMRQVDQSGALPSVHVMSSASADPVATIDGREVLVFCSSNYLGLATHPEVKQAVIDAVEVYGLGANGSRLVSGTTDAHIALEEATARLKGSEAAIAFPTGFMANSGTISALAYLPIFARMTGMPLGASLAEMVVLGDALNHASIIEGRDAARARHATYRHCDLASLEEKLERWRGRRALIVTDAIFSMDGDIAELPHFVEVKHRHKAILMIDEAHSLGVLGATGRGVAEHYGVARGDVDKALEAWTEALRLDPVSFEADALMVPSAGITLARQYYLYAKLLAARGETEKALEYLARAHAEGFTDFGKVEHDRDFATLVIDPRYAALK